MQALKEYNSVAAEFEKVQEIFDQELICDIRSITEMIEQTGRFRGKMLRPLLVLLSGQACGDINYRHRVIAAVSEMVHLATLIHDDVLDEAERRRGGRTINDLNGNEKAVLLGDMFISHAYHLCSSLEDQAVARRIATTTNTVCEGELIQLRYRGRYDLTEEIYLDIITRKTASLMATCCYLGAQAARADEEICRSLEAYGKNVGIAFQIRDDILDLIGDEQEAGKTLGSDLLKEKLTLPGIYYLRHCGQEARRGAVQLLRRRLRQDLREFAERLCETGSIDYARRRAGEFIEQAKKELWDFPGCQAPEDLVRLAHSVLD